MAEDKPMSSEEFIAIQTQINVHSGFWSEGYKRTLLRSLEANYNSLILRDLFIEDVIINGDKIMIKWGKRYTPLTDEKLKEEYGR
jgi:hypothetical protein